MVVGCGMGVVRWFWREAWGDIVLMYDDLLEVTPPLHPADPLSPSPRRPTLRHSTPPTYTQPLRPTNPHSTDQHSKLRPTNKHSEPFYLSYFAYYSYIQNLLYLKIYPIYRV